jgi:transcriptional antiterminator NusG
MQPWFALWTRSRHEPLVCRELERRGFEIFLPTISRWSTWKDRRKKIRWPLFPGYVFARFDPCAWLSVVNCNGVAGIVSFGGEAAPVPDDEIESIRRVVQSELPCDPCPLVREGAIVEVIRGPLTGLTGRLIRIGPHARLVVSVQCVNQSLSVQVEASDIVPIAHHAVPIARQVRSRN